MVKPLFKPFFLNHTLMKPAPSKTIKQMPPQPASFYTPVETLTSLEKTLLEKTLLEKEIL